MRCEFGVAQAKNAVSHTVRQSMSAGIRRRTHAIRSNSLRCRGPRSASEIGAQIVDGGVCLIGRERRAEENHVGDDRLPCARRTPRANSAIEAVADSAAALDDLFACPGGQVHRGGWRYVHPRSKVCGEIRHDRVDLTWADLGAAQDHVVDLVTPGLLALAQPSESAESVTLRACDRDDVSTRTRRQWVGADRASFLCARTEGARAPV